MIPIVIYVQEINVPVEKLIQIIQRLLYLLMIMLQLREAEEIFNN